MSFTVGSLVRARGREWVVLPESSDEMAMLRPLGGGDMEVTGILSGLEEIIPAQFEYPDPRAGWRLPFLSDASRCSSPWVPR